MHARAQTWGADELGQSPIFLLESFISIALSFVCVER